MKIRNCEWYLYFLFFYFISPNKITAQVFALDDVVTTNEEVSVIIHVLANDTNIGAPPLYASLVTLPANGTISLLDADSILYIPYLNFNGIDTFTYLSCNGDEPFASCDFAQVIISVLPVPDYPVAFDDYDTTSVENATTIAVQQNDINYDAEDLVTQIISMPVNGSASVISSDSIQYIPADDFFGDDILAYSVCKSGSAIYCDTANVFMHVNQINFFAPDAVNDYVDVIIGSTSDIDVLANDTDGDGDIVYVKELIYGDLLGEASIETSGYVKYVAPNNGVDSIYYIACDGNSPEYCDTALLRINILDIKVPNSFSPNGDGINDELVIAGLNVYPAFNLKIFNRWGDLVFENTVPDVFWNGTSNKSGSGKLADGTYFYILDLGVGLQPLKGYIVLRR